MLIKYASTKTINKNDKMKNNNDVPVPICIFSNLHFTRIKLSTFVSTNPITIINKIGKTVAKNCLNIPILSI